jgi:transcriptional regulator with XRE-family HTH domain
MKTRVAFGKSLKKVRKAKGLTQEDFGTVSSRTYVSMLERAATSPTLEKIDTLSQVLKVHPLTLLILTYGLAAGQREPTELLKRVRQELKRIAKAEANA